MDFWQIILTPFSLLLRFFAQTFNSYGIALILFTVIVKVVLFPLSLKGKKGMIKMTMVNSQVQEIQKRCGNDRERANQEIQKFYAENKINPLGGCGWSMLPIAILLPLYSIIRRPFKYMMHLTDAGTVALATFLGVEGFQAVGVNELNLAPLLNAQNLAEAARAAGTETTGIFGMFVLNFNFLGIDLSQIPNWRIWTTGLSWGAIGLFLLPLISAGLSLLSMQVSQKTNQVSQNQQQNKSNNLTMILMGPGISLIIGYTLPAALCIYWISNSLLMMIQEVICGRILKKDYEAAQRELEEQQRRAKEAEKERRRKAAERKATAIASGSKKQPKSKKGVDVSASREGLRTYARGRAYDPNRYPITLYCDPNGPGKENVDLQEVAEKEQRFNEIPGVQAPVSDPDMTAEESAANEYYEQAYAPEEEER